MSIDMGRRIVQCTGSTRTRADKLSRGGAPTHLLLYKQVMQGAVVASWLGGFETILQIPEDPTTNKGWRNLPAENAFHVCHYVRDWVYTKGSDKAVTAR